PDGRVSLAWVSAPAGGSDGRLSLVSDVRAAAGGGGSVPPPSELRDSLGSMSIYGEVPPKIAYAPDGTLYAAYLVTRVVPGRRWPVNALRFASSTDGGAHWSAPATVTAGREFGSYDDHALYVGPDGAVYLSWLAQDDTHSSHTYFARSADGGRTWSKPAVIDADASCPCCRTAMATGPDGALYVAWRKIYPGGAGQTEIRDVVVARSTDHGATWGAPVRVRADGWHVSYCPDAGPSIKVGPDNTLHVAWWTGREGHAGVQYARSADGGRTFAAPVPLGIAQFSRAAHVQLALGGAGQKGIVAAAWDDGTRRTPRIVVRVSRDGGRTFGAAEPISAADASAGYPVLALHGDSLTVAWQERSLAAASRDSAAHAHMDPNAATTYVHGVGTTQVVARQRSLQ
ncbi:MAG: putative cytochrome c biosis protein, partial [Gemmatimonadetes bacterium]|nr:putative cytochrome c biosis protein [Gemmatimonadota bacterium]